MSSRELEELQIKVAFLEESLAQLSVEHYQQQRDLDALKERFAALHERMRSQDDSGGEETYSSSDEKPPHY